jgi:hypothetical protein
MDWEQTGLLDDLSDYQAEVAINHLDYFNAIFEFADTTEPAKKAATEYYRNILFTLTSVLCFKNVHFDSNALMSVTARKIKQNPHSAANPEKFIVEILSEITFDTKQQ